jgi:hypothetical protein
LREIHNPLYPPYLKRDKGKRPYLKGDVEGKSPDFKGDTVRGNPQRLPS